MLPDDGVRRRHTASLAVVTNAFDYFFYRGLCIQTDEDILGIFGLSYEDF